MARLLVLCLLAVVAATGARAGAAVFDGALGDDTAGVRVLLEVDAQRQRDAQFAQHVAALVEGLQAQADSRAFVIDETEAAEAEADADAAEELNAAAAIAETGAAEELEAEGLANAPVFGEAAEAEAEVFEAVTAPERADDMLEFSAGPALLEAGAAAQADAEADADSDAAEAAAVEGAADAEDEAEGEVFGEAAEEEAEIVEAIPSEQSLADEREWSAGPAFVEVDAADEDDAEDEVEAVDAAEDEAEDAVEDEADEEMEADDAAEADAEADADAAAFVQVQARVGGDWKDPPVWWKAPEEEMANADQQPWPLDPNFPMSVLDPPPNLPLANIEDANNYPPMADPNLAFNIDPSAFPQTNPKVGADDPSFASFSINGR